MFSHLLNHAIQAAQRYGRQLAVLFVDLDRFKIINDTLGHEAGDQLLQDVATRLKQSLRAVDVVARLGGDEFVILIEEINDLEQVATVVRNVLSNIMKSMTIMDEECRVTASIGISIYPKDAENEQFLMKNADIAMYFAKSEGKNNYQFYSKDIKAQSIERLLIETNLRMALERKEFSLHYQAKLDFKTGVITGVEALLRWQNPSLGSVPPPAAHTGSRRDRADRAHRQMGTENCLRSKCRLATSGSSSCLYGGEFITPSTHRSSFDRGYQNGSGGFRDGAESAGTRNH